MRQALTATLVALTVAAAPLLAADPPRPPKPDVGANHLVWFDLTTTDMAKSKEFYGKLFDWKFTPIAGTDLAVEITSSGTPIGSLRAAEGKISGYNGVSYIQVKDILASCKQVKELGGTVVPGFPFNIPGGAGAIGLFLDPVGHPLGLYSPTPLPEPAKPAH
ncbi:MAG TPA: VOC family protein [Thermoanaerobaculia bacterium]